MTWDSAIVLLVLVAITASAALPLAAFRQWQGLWRLGATLPLVGLLLWVAVIVTGRALDSASHALWAFELFAWAMLNLIYMMMLMTAKRIFAKADAAAEDVRESSD
ncbi:MAG: hypothetical protein ACR2PR_07575 [Pseudohongiellaceae bacterium]